MFEDPDHANGPANAAAVIRYVSSIHDKVDIQFSGNGDDYVTFNPTGDARYTPGQFILCHENTNAMSKSLSVSAVGRIGVEERNQTDCGTGS